MESSKKEEVKKEKKKHGKFIKKILLICLVVIIALLAVKFIFRNTDGQIKIKVKTSLDKVVKQSDLNTVDITYNVIAKKCKKEGKCDTSSNNINDFEYVASCKGTVTAGIDFKEIKIEVDDVNKQLIIEIPEATIKDDPNIGSIKFLNGYEIPSDEYPNARKLCQKTVSEKVEKDNKVMPAAKEQARVVLKDYYEKWIQAIDPSYKVIVR